MLSASFGMSPEGYSHDSDHTADHGSHTHESRMFAHQQPDHSYDGRGPFESRIEPGPHAVILYRTMDHGGLHHVDDISPFGFQPPPAPSIRFATRPQSFPEDRPTVPSLQLEDSPENTHDSNIATLAGGNAGTSQGVSTAPPTVQELAVAIPTMAPNQSTTSSLELNSNGQLAAYDTAFGNLKQETLFRMRSNLFNDVDLGQQSPEALTSDVDIMNGYITHEFDRVVDPIQSAHDLVDREREAIDEVLRRLNDPQKLAGGKKSQVSDQTGSSYESNDLIQGLEGSENVQFAPVPDVADGALILLQAVGDANESKVDLRSVLNDGLELADNVSGVDASLGIRQVLDAALDELPPSELSTPTKDRSSRQSTETDSQADQSKSVRNGAAAVGAIAVIGLHIRRANQKTPERRPRTAKRPNSR